MHARVSLGALAAVARNGARGAADAPPLTGAVLTHGAISHPLAVDELAPQVQGRPIHQHPTHASCKKCNFSAVFLENVIFIVNLYRYDYNFYKHIISSQKNRLMDIALLIQLRNAKDYKRSMEWHL